MDEAAPWRMTELRTIAGRLRASRDRLSGLAGELLRVKGAPAGAEASQTVLQVRRRAWGVAADLAGAVGRLEILALDLHRSGAMDDAGTPPAEAAELLRGTIECVIADRLDPAIQALLEIQRPCGGGEPRG